MGTPAGRPRRCLIVDDHEPLRAVLRRVVTRLGGWTVDEAADGLDALERANTFRPDVVLLDVQLPRADGHAVLTALRQHPFTRQARVIVITADRDLDQRRRMLASGAAEYLFKPVDVARLRELLDAVPVLAAEC